MKKSLLVLLVSIVLFNPFKAQAWGQNGHRIVGEIAFNHVHKKTKKAIQAILGYETPAIASTWADFVKSDPKYDFMYQWHFVNMPSGWSEQQVKQFLDTASSDNIYNKSLALIQQLKDKQSSLAIKQNALKMLIHMIGDLHQPLHIGHADDLGGNKIKVLWFQQPSNIHAVWDEKLIESQALSYTEYAQMIDHADKNQIKTWQQGKLNDWVFDSYQLATKVYAQVQPEQKLSYGYIYHNIALVNQQLEKGGLRLAKVLDAIFASH